jgi:hypothetical protein
LRLPVHDCTTSLLDLKASFPAADLDMNYLAGVLQRHGLEGKWKPWTS